MIGFLNLYYQLCETEIKKSLIIGIIGSAYD